METPLCTISACFNEAAALWLRNLVKVNLERLARLASMEDETEE